MKLPTEFRLVNRKWSVEEMTKEVAEAGEVHGDCCKENATIRIYLDDNFPDEMHEHSFRHEVIHAFLYNTTQPELSKDEEFVDSLAAVWHQYDQTKKGNLKG